MNLTNEDIIETLWNGSEEDYDPDTDDDVVRMKKQELITLEEQDWETTLDELQKDEPETLEERVIENKSKDWRTCAVGESLREILGIREAYIKTTEAFPELYDMGETFNDAIESGSWSKAKETLGKVQNYVMAKGKDISHANTNIIDYSVCPE